IKRVLINNLNCFNAATNVASILSGIPGYAIEDVKLSNIYVETAGGGVETPLPPEFETKYPEPEMFGTTPAYGFFLRHVQNLEMSHVELATAVPDARPAFYLADVDRADFFAITAPKKNAFSLHQVKDLRIG